MKRVLLTGMSGTGKSSVIGELAALGYKAIDTDDGWCEPLPDGRQRWREDAIAALLDAADADVVFIAGCDDGLLPLRPWQGAVADYAEERRLLFVGMTRATTRLVLLTAAERSVRGTVTKCAPSPFLASVDPALLDRRGGAAGGRTARRENAQQVRLF